jgi:hypothetical protein
MKELRQYEKEAGLAKPTLGIRNSNTNPRTIRTLSAKKLFMKRKRRKVERRTFKRLKIAVPLSVRLLGTTKYPRRIKTETRDVSFEGLSIELRVILKNGSLLIQEGVEPIKLIPFLVLNQKTVELDIEIPPEGEKTRAVGRVIWYDFGSRGAKNGS